MKVEKISDTQVKFFLSQSDLNERDINMAELAFGSEKAHALFREMLSEASFQCGFDFENSPIMIEAVTLSAESIMIVVTKITSLDEFENRLALPNKNNKDEDCPQIEECKECKESQDSSEYQDLTIYSFDELDDAVNASVRLHGRFNGESRLYKKQGRYFLLLHNVEPVFSMSELEEVLGEYGQKYASSSLSQYYLSEHGEIMIKQNAVQILAENLG